MWSLQAEAWPGLENWICQVDILNNGELKTNNTLKCSPLNFFRHVRFAWVTKPYTFLFNPVSLQLCSLLGTTEVAAMPSEGEALIFFQRKSFSNSYYSVDTVKRVLLTVNCFFNRCGSIFKSLGPSIVWSSWRTSWKWVRGIFALYFAFKP